VPGLPAVLISGDTAPERLREAHAAGLTLLHKPVSAEQLLAAIEGVLASARAARSR
jgi:CheY-like chemotaxis protein